MTCKKLTLFIVLSTLFSGYLHASDQRQISDSDIVNLSCEESLKQKYQAEAKIIDDEFIKEATLIGCYPEQAATSCQQLKIGPLAAKYQQDKENLSNEYEAEIDKGVCRESTVYSSLTKSSSTSKTSSVQTNNSTSSNDKKIITIALFRLDKGLSSSGANIGKPLTLGKDFEMAKAIASHLNEMSQGKWNVTANAYAVPLMPSSGTFTATEDSNINFAEFYKVYNLQEEYKVYFDMSAGGDSDIPRKIAHVSFGAQVFLLSHELGHIFGLLHAYGLKDGKMSERQDLSTPMSGPSSNSSDYVNAGYNAFERIALRVHNPETTTQITETKKAFLAPLESYASSVPTGKKQIIILIKDAKYYFISYRTFDQKVYLHIGGSGSRSLPSGSQRSEKLGEISAGNSLTSEGVKIEFLKVTSGVAEVNIYKNASDPTPTGSDQTANPTGVCTGERPSDSTPCEGSEVNIYVNTSFMAKKSCSGVRKCEVTCNEGYVPSADQKNCIKGTYICEGEVTLANTKKCEGSENDLTKNLPWKFSSDCVGQCKYTCLPNFEVQFLANTGPSCKASNDEDNTPPPSTKPISISMKDGSSTSKVFTMGKSVIHYEVQNAGENAKGCLDYTLTSGQKYAGCKDSNPETSSAWGIMKDSTEWTHNKTSWVFKNTSDLTKPHYLAPGSYKIYFYNPDTKDKEDFEFTVKE